MVKLDNGHELLAHITGSGCMVGTCVAVFCAAAALTAEFRTNKKLVDGDMLSGAIGGYVLNHIPPSQPSYLEILEFWQ